MSGNIKREVSLSSKNAKRKALFEEFRKIGFEMERLNGIVQNDMPITVEQVGEWLTMVHESKQRLNRLVEETTKFLMDYAEVDVGLFHVSMIDKEFCPKCKNRIVGTGHKFCTSCGAPIQEEDHG